MTAQFPRLVELQEVVGDELVHTMIDMFVSTAQSDIPQLLNAIKQGDCATVRTDAHRMLGGCRNLGLDQLAAVCQHLEDEARAGRVDQTAGAAVQATFESTVAQLREWASATA